MNSGPGRSRPSSRRTRNSDGILAIKKGEPTDRLSDGLFAAYPTLIESQEHVVVEIEITSLLQGAKKQRAELQTIRLELQQAFGFGANGNFFEHEEFANVCRAVIQCSGPMLKRLVEDPRWIRKITWFENRPHFKSFQETVEDFRIELLGEISGPGNGDSHRLHHRQRCDSQEPAPSAPVVRADLLKSFLKSDPENPYDSFGHGSAVASLAAYNFINIAEGAVNEGKVRIASRIVTQDKELEDERLFSSLLTEVVEYFRPLGVRIFNLSLGNSDLKWNQTSRRTADRKSSGRASD